MSRGPSQFLPYKAATIRPASIFPPAAAAAMRRSAWQVTATLLAMLILLAFMAVLSPRVFPQTPPVAYQAEQQSSTLAATPSKSVAHRHLSVEQQRTAMVTIKLWGAGILLLIGLRLLADSPRPPVLRL